MKLEEYIIIKIWGEYIKIRHVKSKKINLEREYDMLELTEQAKRNLQGWLRHYKDLPLVSTYEDLKLIREMGIRI